MNRRQKQRRHYLRQQHLAQQAIKREQTGEKAKPKPKVKQPRKPRAVD